jgi:hypothetical protein
VRQTKKRKKTTTFPVLELCVRHAMFTMMEKRSFADAKRGLGQTETTRKEPH